MKRKVITLCGSIRFMNKMLEMNEALELQGNVVIGVVQHVRREPYTPEEEELMNAIHKVKIDLADAIYVVNMGGYIGSSTRSEIDYAKQHGKEVLYLVEPKESRGTSDVSLV